MLFKTKEFFIHFPRLLVQKWKEKPDWWITETLIVFKVITLSFNSLIPPSLSLIKASQKFIFFIWHGTYLVNFYYCRIRSQIHLLKYFFSLLIDFNGMCTYLGLFCAKRLGNSVYCTFIFKLFVYFLTHV